MNKTKLIYLPWLVWGLSCIFYFYEFLLQVSPGVMSNELMHDFSVTSQTLGILSGVYFYSYAGAQMPGGILLDKFGPHKLLTIATLICALSTIAFGMTSNLTTACIARFMTGFGSAFAVVGSFKLAANWFPSQKFVILTGFTVALGMLGAIGGEAPLAMFIDVFGWRHSMLIMGCVGLVIAGLIFLIVKDKPDAHISEITNHASSQQEPFFASFKLLIKNKQLWLIAIYGGLMYMSTPVFCGLWGVPYLMLKLDITKAVAANYVSLIFIGWIIGSPLWGVFSNHIGKRKPPMYLAAIGSLICSYCFIYSSIHSKLMIQFLLFGFGIFSSGFLPSFTVAKELCRQRYVATGLSFMNMVNMIGIAIAQPVIGAILDYCWAGELINTVRVYSISAYHIALSILPISLFLALIILPAIHETYCQSLEN